MGRIQASARAVMRRIAPPQERVPDRGAVALTFDDGPDPVYTPQVLDVLAEHGACATFFLVGRRVRREPELVRRIVAAGHSVGSHSLTHPEVAELSWRAVGRDYRSGRRVLEQAVGAPVRRFRPPKGHLDNGSAIVMRLCGLQPWLWTVDPEDWRPGMTAGRILERIGALRGGDVVLLHDGIEAPVAPSAADRSATVAALPAIIEAVRADRLSLCRLP
ncbi:MAG: polysaccharide deacetylase family protein [Solirubrobacterales bacterium]|nr:polysaccharide deacetylase family protein [Solirubrobacterales bacterium]